MMINALNSGADTFMADLEDASAPSWANVIDGQVNLRDAVRGNIAFTDTETGRHYRSVKPSQCSWYAPRGLHLVEAHTTVDGTPVPGSLLFDAGLYLFHNATALIERGTGPYFCLPQFLECAGGSGVVERRLHRRAGGAWPAAGNDQSDCPHRERCSAAPSKWMKFCSRLREHMAGLNCGRWDYIISYIKTRRNDPSAVLPDRSQVGMTQPCMRAYTQLVIRTCHRRGAFAMGGMAAQIPSEE